MPVIENDNDATQKTIAKTLWSETLIDLLIISLEKNQPDEKVTDLLKELMQKKFKKDYITGKISKALGEKEANRIKLLLAKI